MLERQKKTISRSERGSYNRLKLLQKSERKTRARVITRASLLYVYNMLILFYYFLCLT